MHMNPIKRTYKFGILIFMVFSLSPVPFSSAGVTITYESQGEFDFAGTIEMALGHAESYLKDTAAKDADGNQLSVWTSASGALNYLESQLRQTPADIELQTAVAIISWGKSRQKGQQLIKQIIRANPTYAKGHCLLAIFALREEDLVGYGRHFEEAIQADPNYVPAYNSLAMYYARGGKREVALDLLARGNA